MGILSSLNGLFGNITHEDPDTVEEMMGDVLVEGERVVDSYTRVRDLIVFTDYRLILVDMQGVTGKKTEYLSLPYDSISHFSMITTGQVDLDTEVRIWMKGSDEARYVIEFNADQNAYEVQKALSKAKFRMYASED